MAYFPMRAFAAPVAARPALATDRRLAGVAVTVLIHVALILVWQGARTLPLAQPEGTRSAIIQWVGLPALPHTEAAPSTPPADARQRHRLPSVRSARPADDLDRAGPAAESVSEVPAPAATPAFSAVTPARPGAESIMESARRSAGSIDRAMRKENRPYITAPLDSPQIRMRNGMELAHEMAPSRLWEAPKIEELVNSTGDGARRTRVITGNGTYCITERSPTTSVDMIEKHGKLRLTNCPQHEDPAKQQEWRTARD
jgi:hypothetical protein